MSETDDDSLSVAEMRNAGDYNSEFEYDSEIERKRLRRSDLARPESKKKTKKPHRTEASEEYTREEGRKDRFHILSLDAYDRHKKFINDYLLYYGGSMKQFKRDTSRDKTDHDVIREHHQFLWSDEDGRADSWESRLAKKYYDKLFKEYCIADLSRYKENKVALRWRIESEVVSGKGQFQCGEKKCKETEGLRSWEVNFGYMEHGQKKNALVKVRLCPECSRRLNYHHKKREAKAKKRKSEGDYEESDSKRTRTDDMRDAELSSQVADRTKSESSVVTTEDKTTENNEDVDVWRKPLPPTEELSREDEFDEYFSDLFL